MGWCVWVVEWFELPQVWIWSWATLCPPAKFSSTPPPHEQNRESVFRLKVGYTLTSKLSWYTVCPWSSDPSHIVRYYITWITTSWTYSNCNHALWFVTFLHEINQKKKRGKKMCSERQPKQKLLLGIYCHIYRIKIRSYMCEERIRKERRGTIRI